MVYYWGFFGVCCVFLFVCVWFFVCVVGAFFSWRSPFFPKQLHISTPFVLLVILSIFLANFNLSLHEARYLSACLTNFVPLPGIIFHQTNPAPPSTWFDSCAVRPALFAEWAAWRRLELEIFLGSTLTSSHTQQRIPEIRLHLLPLTAEERSILWIS